MSYFIHTNRNCSLLDPGLVDPGSTLKHVGAYGSKFVENNPFYKIKPKTCVNARQLQQCRFTLNIGGGE